MHTSKSIRLVGAAALMCAACADDDDGLRTSRVPWADGAEVIDQEGTVIAQGPADPDGCVYVGEFCLLVAERCETGQADVFVDDDKGLLAALCYPPAATISVEQVSAQSGEIAQTANNSVLILDDLRDGPDVAGGVHIDANNVVLYGQGPDLSLVDGDLSIDGNNTIVRGVRITGDVDVLKNNGAIALTAIEGDLTVRGNNVRLYGVDVLGDLTITANNAELVDVHVGGSFRISGNGARCSNSSAFRDENADAAAQPGELGAPLDC